MSVIADLLKELPAAAKYQAALEAMQGEIERLRAENAGLKEELGRFIDRWETLDGDALNTLLYLSRCERGSAAEIARANQVNIQIVEAYLRQLVAGRYVQTHASRESDHYALAHKGRWYLRERRLLAE